MKVKYVFLSFLSSISFSRAKYMLSCCMLTSWTIRLSERSTTLVPILVYDLSRISAPNWFLLPLMLSRSESMVIYSLSGSVYLYVLYVPVLSITKYPSSSNFFKCLNTVVSHIPQVRTTSLIVASGLLLLLLVYRSR